MTDTQTVVSWRGFEMIDRDGHKIGSITEIYLDQQSNEPEWATVKTGLFGTRQTFVPIRDATSEGEIVRVPFEKGHVKDAPNVDADQELSQSEERELYEHYGIDYSQNRSGSQLPEPGGQPGQEPVSEGGQAAAAGMSGGREEGGMPGGEGAATGGTGEADRDAQAEEARGDLERPGEPDRSEGDDEESERAPAPDEGERGVAVPGESDDDDSGGSSGGAEGAGGQGLPEGTRTERVSEERADAPGDGETRLRLRKYVVTEEVRVPVQRTEVRVERDDE